MAARNQVNSTIDDSLADKLAVIKARRGVSPSTIGRLALEFYVPLYEAGQGNPDRIEFLLQVAAALEERPELRTEMRDFMRRKLRVAA